MPEYLSSNVVVEMNEKEKNFYSALENDMVLSVGEDELDAVNAAALSNKLLQMANGAVYGEDKKVLSIHDRKLDALEDLIEAANGKPVLVAYWFKHDRERIMERFFVRDIDTAEDIADWNDGKIPVALIHPASAGHGLNLQEGGSTIIWFSLTWSLELYQQLNARLWRQGQKNTVVIEHIVTKDTVDEDVIRALEKKDAGQSALIEAVKARIGGNVSESRKDDERL
jgi:SNF2 family DNA or RNA helicase